MEPKKLISKRIRISESLEHAVIHAILTGRADHGVVRPEELSKPGRCALQASQSLEKPTFDGVLAYSVEVCGLDAGDMRAYLQAVRAVGTTYDAVEILQRVRDKQILVEIISEAGQQLGRGTPDPGALAPLLADSLDNPRSGLSSVSDRIASGLPEPPSGLDLVSLPKLVAGTGGVFGVWTISGGTGIGKSTLAWQIGLDISAHTCPVLYYDVENGFGVMMDHTRHIFNDNAAKIRQVTKRLYYRDSVRTLESDLMAVPAPALIVVDSLQSLPGSVEYRRGSLDRWIHRFETLKKRGYHTLLISEIGRAYYEGEAYIGAFKESGEIEYKSDAGFQLTELREGLLEVNAVKNRHRPNKGVIVQLERNGWWYKEKA